MSTVSVIILNWNSRHFLELCLRSLSTGNGLSRRELVIVDNGSIDGSPDFVGRMYPEAVFIRNTANRGVAVARNQAIRVAGGDYLFILDVDTIVPPGTIDLLVDFMEQNPEVGLCAPKLVSPNDQLQFSCRLYPTLLSKLARRMPFGWGCSLLADEEMHSWDHNAVREVDYVIGAAQLIRRKVIDEVGLLDEAIFYGPEDIDLCLRIRQAGWKIVYNPTAAIVHHESRITRKVFSIVTLRHVTAMIYYFSKHRYLFSRQTLYRRLPPAPAARRAKAARTA